MSEHETGFRTQWVGGFQRDDVLHYIEQTSRSFTERIEALEEELSRAREEVEEQRARAEELDARSSELSTKDAELLERLGAMTLSEDSLRASLADTQAALDLQTAEAKRLAEENGALREQNAALAEEAAGFRQKCREYESAKEHMAEIELRAYRQAKDIEKKSLDEAERVRGETAAIVDQFRQRLQNAGEGYRSALRRAQDEFSEMHQRACALIESMDAAAGQLGTDKRKREGGGPRGVFSSLRGKDEK